MTTKVIDEKESRAKMLGEGKIEKVLLTLAIPAIIGQIINAIYNIADTYFVGMLNDTAAISSISVAFPIFMIITAIGQAFGVGSASYISRLLGQGKKTEADRTASTTFFTAIFTGIISTIICLIFMERILKFSGASPTIMPYAVSYTRILLIGSVFTIVNMTLNNIIRAEGNAKYSMYAIIIGAVLNIILDPLFILTFKMGVAGAAIATVIGQMVSTIYLIRYFTAKKSYVVIKRSLFTFSKEIYIEIFKIGIPTFCMQFLISYSMSLLNSSAIKYGDAAVAALGITTRLNSFIIYVLFGFMQGFQPLVGYNYGAKKYDRVRNAIKTSTIWATAYCLILTIILAANAEFFVRLFSSDPEVIKIGVDNIIAIGLLRPILGFQLIYTTLFQALGKSKEAGFLSIARQGIFLIPAILFLPGIFERHIDVLGVFTKILPNTLQPGMYGIVYTQFTADFFTFIVTCIFAVSVKKSLKSSTRENENGAANM